MQWGDTEPMSYKSDPDYDIKYCLTCDTHFYAPRDVHERSYHPDGEFIYIEGTWEDINGIT